MLSVSALDAVLPRSVAVPAVIRVDIENSLGTLGGSEVSTGIEDLDDSFRNG